MLKSPNLQFLPFAYHLPNLVSNPLWSISDLKVICARSWGDIEAIKRPQKFKNKLISALFLRTNEKKHTVVLQFPTTGDKQQIDYYSKFTFTCEAYQARLKCSDYLC